MLKRIFFVISIILIFVKAESQAVYSSVNDQTRQPHAKNIILLIGDGMGLAQIYGAYTVNHSQLNMFKMPVVGISLTYSLDNYITDSAAGGTAISTGKKTANGYIAKDTLNNKLVTILEIAKRQNLSTGLVATSTIVHATPAVFIAHNNDRNSYADIALDFLTGNADVFIGGGSDYFIKRKDNRNLADELSKIGYPVCFSLKEAEPVTSGKLACLVAPDAVARMSEGRGDMLPQATTKAISLLSKNKNGFFLMVEGSQIDWGNHNNDIDYTIKEMIDFDNAVGVALNYAAKDTNTLVVVTADHESGGLTLTGGSIEKSTIGVHFSTTHHSAVPVMVFAYGAGASKFNGTYQNTEIFYKMLDAYQFPNKK